MHRSQNKYTKNDEYFSECVHKNVGLVYAAQKVLLCKIRKKSQDICYAF